ncbi:MAG TPA: DUF4105 domain-containing protein [Flavisolibacter sp.]|nr:DUF4105 domain-containing protein [Flavisolibacter sp.]
MKKVFLIILFTISFLVSGFSQDSCTLRISLLTCAPGEELYSTFGHTAIRVQDDQAGLDEVYNYGTFEFDDDFYAKFVRGKLLYALAMQNFPEFMYQYQMESRSVISQELALTCLEKQRLFIALRTNALPQNKNYRYDFLFDNCTTRAGAMVDSGTGANVVLGNILQPEPYTFRNHIDVYLNRANQDWSKLGIDLLLGAKMDRPANNREAMFLPDNLMVAFDRSTIDGRPLVAKKETILKMPSVASESLLLTPVMAFGLFLLLVAALTFVKNRRAQQAVGVLDFILFFSLGLVGVLLLFMWFGTDHALCANNYNLLWALPTNAVAAFFVHKRLRWVKQYFTVVFWLTILLLIAWKFLPQQMNAGFLPLVVAIAIRSWFLSKKKTDANKAV